MHTKGLNNLLMGAIPSGCNSMSTIHDITISFSKESIYQFIHCKNSFGINLNYLSL